MEIGSRSKNILDRIVEARRESVAHRKRVLPEVALKFAVEKKAAPPRDFLAALARDGKINMIAELKKASPSLGMIREDYAPAELAASLEDAGAAALSVLTEEDFFSGSLADLKEAKKSDQIPILRKDFIVDPWQVWEARAAGADSFLLIVAILERRRAARSARARAHAENGAARGSSFARGTDRAIAAGARIIGVNNRDLRDFKVRLETSLELVEGFRKNASP